MSEREMSQRTAPCDASSHPSGPERVGSGRDPEERTVSSKRELREKMLDKTLADSFPTSDPPSSIPDPLADDSLHIGGDRQD